jgi:hypothetical protein
MVPNHQTKPRITNQVVHCDKFTRDFIADTPPWHLGIVSYVACILAIRAGIQQEFLHVPRPFRQPSLDCCRRLDGHVDAAEVVVREEQRKRGFVVSPTFSRKHWSPRQATNVHTDRQVVPLNVAGANLVGEKQGCQDLFTSHKDPDPDFRPMATRQVAADASRAVLAEGREITVICASRS